MEEQNQFQTPIQIPSTPVVTMGEWFVTMLVSAIPLVGLIMLFVWAFGGGNNQNKANWAKATLIFAAIAVVLYILIIAYFGFDLLKKYS